MNSKTTLLLSLLLITGSAAATQQYQESSGSEFSVDELKFNLEDEENRNQPPQTNQIPANSQSGQ